MRTKRAKLKSGEAQRRNPLPHYVATRSSGFSEVSDISQTYYKVRYVSYDGFQVLKKRIYLLSPVVYADSKLSPSAQPKIAKPSLSQFQLCILHCALLGGAT